jgi:hypothetical protein
MGDKTLAYALDCLATLGGRMSLAQALTDLAALSLRHWLAHALRGSPAAQSLGDGPAAARLCRHVVTCGLGRLDVPLRDV